MYSISENVVTCVCVLMFIFLLFALCIWCCICLYFGVSHWTIVMNSLSTSHLTSNYDLFDHWISTLKNVHVLFCFFQRLFVCRCLYNVRANKRTFTRFVCCCYWFFFNFFLLWLQFIFGISITVRCKDNKCIQATRF